MWKIYLVALALTFGGGFHAGRQWQLGVSAREAAAREASIREQMAITNFNERRRIQAELAFTMELQEVLTDAQGLDDNSVVFDAQRVLQLYRARP